MCEPMNLVAALPVSSDEQVKQGLYAQFEQEGPTLKGGKPLDQFVKFLDIDETIVRQQAAFKERKECRLPTLRDFGFMFSYLSHTNEKTDDPDKIVAPSFMRLWCILTTLNDNIIGPVAGIMEDSAAWRFKCKSQYTIRDGYVVCNKKTGREIIDLESMYRVMAECHLKMDNDGNCRHLCRQETIAAVKEECGEAYSALVTTFLAGCPGCKNKPTVLSRHKGHMTTKANNGNQGKKKNCKRSVEKSVDEPAAKKQRKGEIEKRGTAAPSPPILVTPPDADTVAPSHHLDIEFNDLVRRVLTKANHSMSVAAEQPAEK